MQFQQDPLQLINTNSQDIIHDISFDWYGKRIATCSSDKTIRFYSKKESKWIQEKNVIRSQGGPLWRVKWARPEFGLIIATCSLDKQVKIYQQKKNDWIQQFKITDSKESVQDIKFSPNNAIGLLLATASSDGFLKIYQAQDQQNLKNWTVKYNFLVNDFGVNCLSWNKSPFQEMMIAVGCKDLQRTYKKPILEMMGQNKQTLKINTNTPSLIFLIRNNQTQLAKLQFAQYQKLPINDISWALNNGRSFHLLAISTDKFVKIYYFKINQIQKKVIIIKNFEFAEAGYRLSWNILATHLAVSDIKNLRIYKRTNSNWNLAKRIEQTND